ncbi:hypothetical protein AAC387_Pa08g0763 [Persea americana]
MFEGARWAVRGMNRVAGRPPVTKVRESIELCQGFPELLHAISISSPSVLFFTNRIHASCIFFIIVLMKVLARIYLPCFH